MRSRGTGRRALGGFLGGATLGAVAVVATTPPPAGAHWDASYCPAGTHRHMAADPYLYDYSNFFDGTKYAWATLYAAGSWGNADFAKVHAGEQLYVLKANHGPTDYSAYAQPWLDPVTCGITSAVIVFNTHYTDGMSQELLNAVAAHEFGHVVGFYDINNKNCKKPLSIMFGDDSFYDCGLTGPTAHDLGDANGFYAP